MESDPNEGVVSRKIRWLAILAACSSAVFGAAAFGSPFLLLGTVIQPWARTAGRWLMWLGVFLLSVVVIPLGTAIVFEKAARNFTMYPAFVLSTALVYCTDLAIVLEAVRSWKNQRVTGRLDWVVWIAAAGASAWCVWQTTLTAHAYRSLGGLRPDLILNAVGLDALILWFDVALVVLVIKTRRVA